MWICDLAAEYYIANQRWPESKEQLAKQNEKVLSQEREHLSPDEINEGSGFLERFTTIKLKNRGNKLVFHYEFNVEKRKVKQTVIFSPGSNADEILTSAMSTSWF